MKILGEHGPPIIIILETKKEMEIMKALVGLYKYSPTKVNNFVADKYGIVKISSTIEKFVDKIYDFLGWRTEDEILS